MPKTINNKSILEEQRRLIPQIKKLLIKTDRLASQILAGEYKSAFKGTGLNFDSIREYQIGDEIRRLDWKVTARMQSPYIRKYTEERQMTLMLILDLSASNNFGSKSKSKKEMILEIAAVLSFLAIKNNDKVGMMLITDQVETYVPAKQGKAHIFRLIKDIMTFEPFSPKTNLKNSLKDALNMMPKDSVVFLISDLIDSNSFIEQETENSDDQKPQSSLSFSKELKLINKMHDLVALSIRDTKEFALPQYWFY